MKFEKDIKIGKILGVYSSVHPEKSYKGDDYFITQAKSQLELTTEGILGDRHFGYQATSGGRFATLYQKGTIVRNNRQWLALSPNEVQLIGSNLEVDNRLTPELLGANFLIEGLGDMSALPMMTHLVLSSHDFFKPGRSEDTTLIAYAQALPCTVAGKALVQPLSDASLEKKFPKAAINYRGLTGWIEHGGIVKPDYYVFAMTPKGID